MNLDQLKIFYLAAKHGSLSAAAEALCITQPAVTKGIQRLQDYDEIKLFNRFEKKDGADGRRGDPLWHRRVHL